MTPTTKPPELPTQGTLDRRAAGRHTMRSVDVTIVERRWHADAPATKLDLETCVGPHLDDTRQRRLGQLQ
jgi:hypothetical protein